MLTNHHVVDAGTVVQNRDNAKITITTRVTRIDVCFSPEPGLVPEMNAAEGIIAALREGDAGIGFATPVNDAKDFLETQGLDQLMPTRRLYLGPSGVGASSAGEPELDDAADGRHARRSAGTRGVAHGKRCSGPLPGAT